MKYGESPAKLRFRHSLTELDSAHIGSHNPAPDRSQLQNLHHRFDSGRRLQQKPLLIGIFAVRELPVKALVADILPTKVGGDG